MPPLQCQQSWGPEDGSLTGTLVLSTCLQALLGARPPAALFSLHAPGVLVPVATSRVTCAITCRKVLQKGSASSYSLRSNPDVHGCACVCFGGVCLRERVGVGVVACAQSRLRTCDCGKRLFSVVAVFFMFLNPWMLGLTRLRVHHRLDAHTHAYEVSRRAYTCERSIVLA